MHHEHGNVHTNTHTYAYIHIHTQVVPRMPVPSAPARRCCTRAQAICKSAPLCACMNQRHTSQSHVTHPVLVNVKRGLLIAGHVNAPSATPCTHAHQQHVSTSTISIASRWHLHCTGTGCTPQQSSAASRALHQHTHSLGHPHTWPVHAGLASDLAAAVLWAASRTRAGRPQHHGTRR